MNNDLLERMGQLIDKLENNLAATQMSLPAHIHLEGLKACVEQTRDELFAIYTDAGGEDVWGWGINDAG